MSAQRLGAVRSFDRSREPALDAKETRGESEGLFGNSGLAGQ